MSLKTNNRKYLVLRTDSWRKPGLDHSLSVFKSAIAEATYLGRTLVINRFYMHSQHNLGHPAENLEYKRYINLDKTRIYKTEPNGSLQQINDFFHYIDAENFDLNEYPEKDILLIDEDIRPITEAENNQYEVIVRKTADFAYYKNHPDILVSLYPSDEVESLTNVVLKTMGTSLDEVKKRELIYQGIDLSANREIFDDRTPDTALYYATIHVRTNDIYDTPVYGRYWNSTRHLKHIINRGRSLPKGSKIYIMSDLHDPHYFDFLKKDYIVYQYFDFPELEALVSKNNDSEIDNVMLYSVEKNILQHAHIKMVRAKDYPQIIYINFSYNIPILSIHPQYLHPQFLRRQLLKIIRKIPGIERM